MNILNRYVSKLFIKNIVILMASFISIYILIDFFEKIDDFTEKGKPMALVVKFFFLNIPFVLDQMGPICILLAGVLTIGSLNHSNELIALKAAGIPLKKISRPIIICSIVATMLLLAMAQFVLPKTVPITNKIWYKDVKGRVATGIFRNGRFYYKGEEGFYSFARPDPQKDHFIFFSYSAWDDDYRLKILINAEHAVWKDNKWTLYKGQQQRTVDGRTFETKLFKEQTYNFPEKPANFFIPKYRSMELSLLDLYKEVVTKRTPEDRRIALAKFYGRVSYILLGLPLLLAGLPMMLFVYRSWGKDLALAIPLSCGLAFICWGIWSILQSMALTGYIHPLLAASLVHIIVGTGGLYFLWREDR